MTTPNSNPSPASPEPGNLPVATGCPNDTNGDGDCGRPLCPFCGKERRNLPVAPASQPPPTSGMDGVLLYTIRDAEGHLNHTIISTIPEECIKDWMEQDVTIQWIANVAREGRGQEKSPLRTWADYLHQGYSVVSVEVIEASKSEASPSAGVVEQIQKEKDALRGTVELLRNAASRQDEAQCRLMAELARLRTALEAADEMYKFSEAARSDDKSLSVGKIMNGLERAIFKYKTARAALDASNDASA